MTQRKSSRLCSWEYLTRSERTGQHLLLASPIQTRWFVLKLVDLCCCSRGPAPSPVRTHPMTEECMQAFAATLKHGEPSCWDIRKEDEASEHIRQLSNYSNYLLVNTDSLENPEYTTHLTNHKNPWFIGQMQRWGFSHPGSKTTTWTLVTRTVNSRLDANPESWNQTMLSDSLIFVIGHLTS
jgi:hypothetical protein